MKNLLILLAFLCWRTTHAQTPINLGVQNATFPSFPEPEENLFETIESEAPTPSEFLKPHISEPGFVISTENKYTFHNVVFNPMSKTVTNLNILIGKRADYYCFFSYSPAEKLWYSSVGVSKSFEVVKGAWVTPYAEWGCDSFNPKSWLIEVGIVYGLDLGQIKFKNKKTKKPKGIDCS